MKGKGCSWVWSNRVKMLWPILHNVATGIQLKQTRQLEVLLPSILVGAAKVDMGAKSSTNTLLRL